jgi:prepilin peptidase CpaA
MAVLKEIASLINQAGVLNPAVNSFFLEMSFVYSALIALLFISVFTDLLEERVPNILIIMVIGTVLLFRVHFGRMDSLIDASLGMLAGFTLFFPLWLIGVMGAGDAKLLSAIGVCLGPSLTLEVAAYSVIFGGLFAIFYLLRKKAFLPFLKNTKVAAFKAFAKEADLEDWESIGKNPVAFAPVIALAVLFVLGSPYRF